MSVGLVNLVKKGGKIVCSDDDGCDRGCEACDVSTCEGGMCDQEG